MAAKYFSWEGRHFLNMGTIHLQQNKMTAPNAKIWDEPIELSSEVINWLEAHESREYEDITGVPTFEFPDFETLTAFTKEFDIVISSNDSDDETTN